MPKSFSGQCACGAIRYEFDTAPGFIANCHCNDCKRASGGEMATFFAVPEDDFNLTRGAPKAFHYTANSGHGLDRNFCPDCGSRVFTSNLEAFPKTIFVQLGTVDRPGMADIAPKLEMFVTRRLPWNTPLDLPQYPEMPG